MATATATLPPLAGTTLFNVHDIKRRGPIMRPQENDASEVMGVLNPAGVKGPDGYYYLFPRQVAERNYSRIGIARVLPGDGDTLEVERLGVALEPREPYEIASPTTAGCEDARVTRVEGLGYCVMAYTGLGPRGPRIILAVSEDLRTWQRLGPVQFAAENGLVLNSYLNKDAALFPEPLPAPDGRLSWVLMHRPSFETWRDLTCIALDPPRGVTDPRPSIWLSYCPVNEWPRDGRPPTFGQHHVLATPQADWEVSRIGGGTVPVKTAAGWLFFYHGVCMEPKKCYQAGFMVLDADNPRRILQRSTEPMIGPETAEEKGGTVDNVVFPTAVDIIREGALRLYYGAADFVISVADVLFGFDQPAQEAA